MIRVPGFILAAIGVFPKLHHLELRLLCRLACFAFLLGRRTLCGDLLFGSGGSFGKLDRVLLPLG